jgi:hypothetical protein
MGVGIATGTNVYLLNGSTDLRQNVAGVAYPPGSMGLVVYPPVTGFTMLPFAFFPFFVAKTLWFLVINGTLVLGVRALVRSAAPRAGAHLWMATSGAILLSAAIRWGMMLLQGAPIVLGLLCLFVVALQEERFRWAAVIAAFVTAFKMTLALPFLGLLLLYRRFGSAVTAGATWLALNALGFLRMGAGAFGDYRRSVAAFEAVDDSTNINSPNPWTPVSLPRLDWVNLFYGVTSNISFARAASLVSSALVALWIAREGLRAQRPFDLSTIGRFLAPLVCLGCLCVYHHQYDLCLFFAPLLLVIFDPALKKPTWAIVLIWPLALIMLFMPIGTAEHIAETVLGFRGVGLLKLSFPASLSLALAGTLVVLHRGFVQAAPRNVLQIAPGP